jgi:ADP-ribose pyrophosphatase YjhB (NUDIX family)
MSSPTEAALGYCFRCGTALEARFQEDRERPTCPRCGFIHYLDPKVAVAVILGTSAGVWLGRRVIDPGAGAWSFPAGYVNRGEVLESAAIREVTEELGVTVQLTGLVGVYSEAGESVVLIVYAGDVVAGTLAADGVEVSEVRCFALDALPTELAFPHDRQVLEDWKRAVETGSLSVIRGGA